MLMHANFVECQLRNRKEFERELESLNVKYYVHKYANRRALTHAGILALIRKKITEIYTVFNILFNYIPKYFY